jgi:hypothetical protein
VGLVRDLYRCVLAVSLGLVLAMAMVVFLLYLLAGSAFGWLDGTALASAEPVQVAT